MNYLFTSKHHGLIWSHPWYIQYTKNILRRFLGDVIQLQVSCCIRIWFCFKKRKSRLSYIGLFTMINVLHLLQEIYEEQWFIRAYLWGWKNISVIIQTFWKKTKSFAPAHNAFFLLRILENLCTFSSKESNWFNALNLEELVGKSDKKLPKDFTEISS